MIKCKSLYVIFALALSMYYISCKSELFAEGKRVYSAYCSNCHMDDGSGLANLIPPLTDKKYLKENISEIPCIILHGQKGELFVDGRLFNGVMPPQKLSDIQLLNLINYVTNSWGNDLGYTTISDIEQWKTNCD